MAGKNDTSSGILAEIKGVVYSTCVSVGVFSLFTNLLVLVVPLYMLQIYDRVLSTRSGDTLAAITIIALVMVVIHVSLEYARDRFLAATSVVADEKLRGRVFDALANEYQRTHEPQVTRAISDLDQVRQFLTGRALISLVDAPWAIVFVAVLFMLHEALGAFAVGVILLMVCVGLYSEFRTKKAILDEFRESKKASIVVERSIRNFDALISMGIMANFKEIWAKRHAEAISLSEDNLMTRSNISLTSHGIRQLAQILILCIAAYLAINDSISPGMLIAANILFMRAIGPFEGAIGVWQNIVRFRDSFWRLRKSFDRLDGTVVSRDLPAPTGRIRLEDLVVIPPGSKNAVLARVNLSIEAGEAIAVTGPSGAGKSTLLKTMVGAWLPDRGKVRYDGFDINDWDPAKRGLHVGYLPQDVELFDGTIADNISRFQPDAEMDQIIAAATKAGVHDLILALPSGYETQLGVYGGSLSGGQRQRVGLARALYGNPKIVVLDEPDASLDTSGLLTLKEKLAELKQQSVTIILATHNVQLLNIVDRILVVKAGRIERDGDRDSLVKSLTKPVPVRAPQTAAEA
jgi:PrtD family type I secretion system ABC transporter